MPEVRLLAPVKATYVDDVENAPDTPGAFDLTGDPPRVMLYVCPCGCGRQGVLDLRVAGKPVEHPSWEFDGNRERPTLSPSVHHVGHWHGWLQNGEWRQA